MDGFPMPIGFCDGLDDPVLHLNGLEDEETCRPYKERDHGAYPDMARTHSERSEYSIASAKSADSGYSSSAPLPRTSTEGTTPSLMAISSPAAFETKTHAISVEVASQPGRKIPPEEWEKHKEEILDIFRGKYGNDVRRHMLENKIPRTAKEWEEHKQEIHDISRGRNVNDVRRHMLEKHGFEATYV